MAHERSSSRLLSVLAALALPLGALGQESRLGSEFQVNIQTTNSQTVASVAADAAGDFVVVWESYGQDGSGYGIFARRFSSAGAALASEFQVNTYTTNYQRNSSVAADADGDFVVAWFSYGQDGSTGGVFARQFSSAGAALASEFRVNTYTTGYQAYPSVAADGDGDFVVAWHSLDQDGYDYGVFARRFSSAGAALASEFQVNTYTINDQTYPSVTADADGDFVVAWRSRDQDGSGYGVFARRFSSAGAALASEFQVNTFTTSGQAYPSVAAQDSGDFVVAWASIGQDGSGYGVFARAFSSTGASLASEFQVNTHTASFQGVPSAATGADGDFVVAWESYGQDASSGGIFARRLSSTGAPLAREFQVNAYTAGSQYRPAAAAANADGDFVVVWESKYQDGSTYGVFAQRFAGHVTLDIDGDGAVEPLTDGLLLLRFLFGFTGSTLITGAVDTLNCTRCDATGIEGYLASILSQLDIDGDGAVEPLTDGLLVLRFLFGFTGSTLTTGAVDTQNCTRCDAAAIEPYLAGLTS